MHALGMFAIAHLRGDWRRTITAASAILIAVTSFVVLTGTVETQRLQVTQQVDANYRSTYDILVRPADSATKLEKSDGVVRPNFLSGSYGGITFDQVKQIAATPGVEVAAPVAVLGQTTRNVLMTVNVGSILGNRNHAMVRFGLHSNARNMSGTTVTQRGFLYLTRNRITTVDAESTGGASPQRPAQIEHSGTQTITACLASDAAGKVQGPSNSFEELCWSSRTEDADSPRVEAVLCLPLTVAAVDPAAESVLTGLDQAVVDGRQLTDQDSYTKNTNGPAPVDVATAVMASNLPLDLRAHLTVEELGETTIQQVLATKSADMRRDLVNDATPLRQVGEVSEDADDAYRRDVVARVDTNSGVVDQTLLVTTLNRPGDVSYTGTGPLRPAVVPFDAAPWLTSPDSIELNPTPPTADDTGYRHSTGTDANSSSGSFLSFQIVGKYDPDKLPRPSTLNEVPLETYRSSYVEGADEASRTTLGDKPMLSDLNPSGYIQSPPALLVPLAALPVFKKHFPDLDDKAPVGSVRVRVAGIAGLDPVAREKIRSVAEKIRIETGLDVDITIGSSLQNKQIALPATASGTPALLLNERWTKKGVAVAISQAIDTKSLVLSILVLASSGLTVALIAVASVQARRRELATLSCLGWRASKRRFLVAVELGIIGLTSGIAGAALSVPIAAGPGVDLNWWAASAAIPIGLLLALISGLAAMLAAGRLVPMDAFRPRQPPERQTQTHLLHGPGSLGVMLVANRPSRLVLGALAVALAVSSGLLLTSIITRFQGAVIGSFLGDAVALQVRTPDIAAALVLALLSLTAVATVLLLGTMEDATSFAALRAIGWTDSLLARTLVAQAGLIGLVGAIFGAVIGYAIVATMIGATIATVAIAIGLILMSTLACVITGVVPAALAARLPTARVLASE